MMPYCRPGHRRSSQARQTSSTPQAPRFGNHAEQGREQRPVRPAQVWPARLPSLQDRELMAQDQDLRGLPCLIAPGHRPAKRTSTAPAADAT